MCEVVVLTLARRIRRFGNYRAGGIFTNARWIQRSLSKIHCCCCDA